MIKITRLDKNNYKDFDLSKYQNSFWQSWIWIDIILSWNQAQTVFILEKEWKYIIVEKRKITFGFWLFVLWTSDENIDFFRENLINLSKKESCLFLQFETINYKGYLEKTPPAHYELPCIMWGGLRGSYYKKFITPYTAVIDLNKSEEEILASMKPKWRYNIKLAEKNDIVVKKAEITDENIEIFYNLMMETTSRDSFSGNIKTFYKKFLNSSENNILFIAYKGEVPIAAWIFVYFWEVATYYYWASSSDKAYRNLMSPYLLQWIAIKEAKSRWCKLYDFLWIASANEENSSLAWVTDFKLKLTPDSREVSHSEIYINNKIKYNLIILLKKIRN